MTFNFSIKPAVNALTADINAALAEVAAKHGISIKCSGYSYTAESATIKLECGNLGDGGEVIPKHRSDFKRAAMYYGLVEADLGTRITNKGTVYALDGLMPNRPTRPIVMKRVQDDKIFIFDRSILPEIIAKRPVKSEA